MGLYRVKSNGPKTEPWGTPHEVGGISEKQFPILMACRLSARYEENQCNGVPDMQYQVDEHLMRMSWSMVSNVADRSSMVSVVTLSFVNLFKYF